MIEKNEALRLIRSEYDRLDRICRVDTSGITLKLSSRMTRRFGCFSVKRKYCFSAPEMTVTISEQTLSDDALFLDVIRHEYAHAAVFLRDPRRSHGHDAVWKAVCREVGCEPKATRKAPDYVPPKSRPEKFLVKCVYCGSVSGYKSESKVVKIAEGKLYGRLTCRKCGGTVFTVEDMSPGGRS